MMEETGITPAIGNLLYVQQYMDDDVEQLEFFFHITNADDYLRIDLTSTSHGVEEIAEYDFVDPVSTYLLPKFLSETDIAHDIATGQTKVFNSI